MFDALRDLGRGRWIGPALGVKNSRQDRLWDEPFSVGLDAQEPQRWFWPHDLAVSFELEWLEPVDVAWLGAVSATLAQPVNLVGNYAGEAVVGIGGLLVWPGWNDPEVDPRQLDLPWVIGMPDSQGRVLGWEQRSLEAALDLVHDSHCANIEELEAAVGLRLVDARTEPGERPEPLAEEPF